MTTAGMCMRRAPSAVGGPPRTLDVLWLVVFNLLLFQMPIQNATGFSYADEVVTLAGVGLAVWECSRHGRVRITKDLARAAACLAAFVALGLLSDLVADLQPSLRSIAIDVFTCVKFPLALVGLLVALRGRRDLLRMVELECKIVIVALLVFGIANLFVPIADFGGGSRYGLRASFRFVFGHPEFLVFACVGMVLVFVADYQRNFWWIAGALVVAALSLRAKAIGFVVVAALLLLTWRRRGRLEAVHLVIGVPALVAVGWASLEAYYRQPGAARAELALKSVAVANRYFPLGSGFATYGSAVTATTGNYSPLYYELGLNTVMGLEPGDTAFLSDTFWPIVIGQCGWLGLILYVLFLVFFFLYAYRYRDDASSRLASTLCFLFLLISSAGESAFFHPESIFLAFCLALVLAAGGNRETPQAPGDPNARRAGEGKLS